MKTWLVVPALVWMGAGANGLAVAGQPSLVELARHVEDQRRHSADAPSQVYTNADLARFERGSDAERPLADSPPTKPAASGERPSGSPLSCQSEDIHDEKSGNEYLVKRCSDHTTSVQAFNPRTGAKWQWTVFPDGSEAGIDSCGSPWTYDARTTVYRNANGDMRFGESAFRTRMDSPASCEAEPDERTEETEPSPVPVTEGSPSLPFGFPVWAVIPRHRPRGISPEDKREMIEKGRTGGMVWGCGDPQADPGRCLENGSLRKR